MDSDARVGTASRHSRQFHSQVPGLGHRVSGSGYQHQVQVPAILHPYLKPNTRTRLPIAETRDLKIFPPPATWGCHPPPENENPCQSSGLRFPFELVSLAHVSPCPRAPSRLRRGPPSPPSLLEPAHRVIRQIKIAGEQDSITGAGAVAVREPSVGERDERVAA